jgi:hypothetical protein
LASLFKTTVDTTNASNETLKYKAPKQPQQQQQQPSAVQASAPQTNSILFHSAVQAFK